MIPLKSICIFCVFFNIYFIKLLRKKNDIPIRMCRKGNVQLMSRYLGFCISLAELVACRKSPKCYDATIILANLIIIFLTKTNFNKFLLNAYQAYIKVIDDNKYLLVEFKMLCISSKQAINMAALLYSTNSNIDN